MAILLLDNFDSFTFNLKHYLEQFDVEVIVKRNNEISLEEMEVFHSIVISPGPGLPQDAGISLDAIKTFSPTKKILGVCLGHQAIGLAFGAKLKNLDQVLHGIAKPSKVLAPTNPLFTGIPADFSCARYHSWVIDSNNFPNDLEIIASDLDGEIMAIKHKFYNVLGVQFHPESILTPLGLQLIENWIKYC